MTRRKKTVVIAALCMAAFSLYLALRGDDAGAIGRLLNDAAAAASEVPKLHPLERLGQVRRYAAHLAPVVHIELQSSERTVEKRSGKEEIEKQALGLANSLRDFQVRVERLAVEPHGETAIARFHIHALGGVSGIEGQFYEAWDVTAHFENISNVWAVTRVEGRNLRD